MIKIIKKTNEVTSYLIVKNNQAFLIDPGNHFQEIEDYLVKNQIILMAIFITDGHFRHYEELEYFLLKYSGIDIYIANQYRKALFNSRQNKSLLYNKEIMIDKIYNKKLIPLFKGSFTIMGYLIEIIEISIKNQKFLLILMNENYILFIGDILSTNSWSVVSKKIKKYLISHKEYLIYSSNKDNRFLNT